MNAKRYDKLIQKYLHKELNAKEQTELLDFTMITLNRILVLIKELKPIIEKEKQDE